MEANRSLSLRVLCRSNLLRAAVNLALILFVPRGRTQADLVLERRCKLVINVVGSVVVVVVVVAFLISLIEFDAPIEWLLACWLTCRLAG